MPAPKFRGYGLSGLQEDKYSECKRSKGWSRRYWETSRACASHTQILAFRAKLFRQRAGLSGTKIASQNRSHHGSRKSAHNHSAAEIAGFFASPAAKKSLAASDFWGYPQNRRKLAATTAASRSSRAISRPQRPRDTKQRTMHLLKFFCEPALQGQNDLY